MEERNKGIWMKFTDILVYRAGKREDAMKNEIRKSSSKGERNMKAMQNKENR